MDTLLKKLQICGTVRCNGWNEILAIHRAWLDERLEKIEHVWHSWFDKSNYLSDISTWSTFGNTCTDITLTVDKLTVIIYDGENLNGRRKDKRFTISFKIIDQSFIENFKSSIDWSFRGIIEDAYDNELRIAKQIRLEQIAESWLSSENIND